MVATICALLLATSPEARVAESFLHQYAETRRFAAGRPASARLTPDGAAALFLRSGPRSPVQSLFETDLATGQTRELLSAATLLAGAAQVLSPAEKARLERERISARGLTHFELSRDGRRVVVAVGGRLWLYERGTGAVRPLGTGSGAVDPKLSPDGARLAFVRAHDLWVVDVETGAERQLTTGGTAEVSHGLAEFVAQEELDRRSGFWWSPDGQALAYAEADTRGVEKLALADPVHPERGAEPVPYPRAGRANARVRVGVVPARGGETTWLAWDAERHPYLAAVAWEEGAPLSLVVLDRAQREALLLAAEPGGRVRTLLAERDPAWVNARPGFPRWLPGGAGFLWVTERRGAPELELRRPDGALDQVLVPASGRFEALAGVDPATRTVWFTGSPDPTATRLYRVRPGSAVEPVDFAGEGAAWRSATLARGGGALLVSTASSRQQPRQVAFRTDGTRLAELPSVAEAPPLQPTTELRRVGAGPGFYAAVTRPRDFRPGQKLPVVVQVYGGPHHREVQQVPKLLDQWLADQGFLVVSFDGRGTPGRGRDFERAIQGDFAGPALDDQVAALKALAAELPELDLARVGATGWSFGGYLAALAVLRRPDVFRAAVAGAPVADWRDYDTCYTERYLGLLPEAAAAYDRSSLLTYAPALARPLLLVHGTVDDNVWLSHTLKLSDALFRAGKRHEVLPLSGLTHMVPDPVVTERLQERIAGFFREHLEAGARPIH
ncbi:S9 family peptidase [Anaeromyxobacter paludicola]|uniref:Peptidase n=1 Tax=Anaeromyxobacter paludicola TaxID=2918171 RepID=A0ABM7X893_9BACT|nr:DPP IV N-terminal domain-containing protein [Anaeromyxobacter paludicola]BDG08057.1 peptidase [Anaeromyxobacter paludicola]